jgi:glutamate dehydrogenase (NAD(P)+)
MGTFPADFLGGSEDPLPLWARSHEGLGMDDLTTGHGVKAAAEAALAHLARILDGATVAIEGFGKEGAGTARACARAGARVVGVSTVHGLLANPDGLDIESVVALRRSHGDGFVQHGARPMLPREALFELDCDVLVPCARPDSITVRVAERVRCAVVAPGANIPYGRGAVEVLHRRGILAVPDFVANAGGVHLYASVGQDDPPEVALAAIEAAVREAGARTLATSAELGITPFAVATSEARNYLAQTTGAPRRVLDELFSAG